MPNLRDLIDARFGTKTETRINPGASSIGVAALVILPNNPKRLSAIINNLGAAAVYIKPAPDVSASSGVRLAPNGGQATLIWDEDFELTGYEWWAIADAPATAVLTLEVVTR